MCGVIGIIGTEYAAYEVYNGMLLLQHRGQDSCGIATFDGQQVHVKKGPGLVTEQISEKDLERLKGNVAIGHTRYPTVGSDPTQDAQPFFVNYPYGIFGAHNGNIANYEELRQKLLQKGKRLLTSKCDVELILNIFAYELSKAEGLKTVEKGTQALARLMEKMNGSYSVVAYIAGKGIVAFRDPHGIRPLVMGEKEANGKKVYSFASETQALDFLGYKIIKDLKPGEAVFIDDQLNVSSGIIKEEKPAHCMFEWVYFARPDAVIENKSVYQVRIKLGENLGKQLKVKGINPDVIIPVPDSSRPAALGVSIEMNIPYHEGIIKNRYSQRTFIMPNQEMREKAVIIKLSPIIEEIKGKEVLIIDDSIVRGTTSKKIIAMLRKAGASKVHMAISCPMILYPCYYGVDMSTEEELIASKKTIDEIAEYIGADTLTYQTVEDLKNSIGLRLCTGCLTGDYPTDLTACKQSFSDQRKSERKISEYLKKE